MQQSRLENNNKRTVLAQTHERRSGNPGDCGFPVCMGDLAFWDLIAISHLYMAHLRDFLSNHQETHYLERNQTTFLASDGVQELENSQLKQANFWVESS